MSRRLRQSPRQVHDKSVRVALTEYENEYNKKLADFVADFVTDFVAKLGNRIWAQQSQIRRLENALQQNN